MKDSNVWVNGGYYVLRNDVFRYIKPGEEFVYEPMQRMIAEAKSLVATLRRILAVHGYV